MVESCHSKCTYLHRLAGLVPHVLVLHRTQLGVAVVGQAVVVDLVRVRVRGRVRVRVGVRARARLGVRVRARVRRTSSMEQRPCCTLRTKLTRSRTRALCLSFSTLGWEGSGSG